MKHPCVPASSWRAGWQAGRHRGLPRSLWQRAGDGLGARGAWSEQRSAPGAAALLAGREGGLSWSGGGYRAYVP